VDERLRDESGFGLLELLVALTMLNIALFATLSAFGSSTVAIARAGRVSAATAVADKQMEIYRSLQNCAIWLQPSGTFTTPAGKGIPASNSVVADDVLYKGDTAAYSYSQNGVRTAITFFDNSQSAASQAQMQWATSQTSQAANTLWAGDIPTSCTPTAGTTPPPTATYAEQNIAGPTGTLFPVFTYINIIQPWVAAGTASASTWVKQVTVVVRDPVIHSRVLARETTIFNPLSG